MNSETTVPQSLAEIKEQLAEKVITLIETFKTLPHQIKEGPTDPSRRIVREENRKWLGELLVNLADETALELGTERRRIFNSRWANYRSTWSAKQPSKLKIQN